MRIDDDEVRHIATLAHLEFSDGELARMGEQLSHILDYIDQLKMVELTEPAAVEALTPTTLAEDIPQPSLPREAVERNAPLFLHGHFAVPKIIGGE